MSAARDSFFADVFLAAPTSASSNVVELELDDEHWFQDAARDTLTTDTSLAPQGALGAAALAVDQQLVCRPARRRQPPRAEGAARAARPRGGRDRRWIVALSAVLAAVVLTVAAITSPPHAPAGLARTREPTATPRTHKAPAVARAVIAAHPATRLREHAPAHNTTVYRLRRRRLAVQRTPTPPTVARPAAHAVLSVAVGHLERPRASRARVTPGDLPPASQAP